MKRRKLTARDVEFSVSCEPELDTYIGNCMASGDDEVDKQAESWIRGQLEQGNEWAWCCICVAAKWNGLEGTAYLGACSYESEEQFRQPGGYFEDMKKEALDDLNREVEDLGAKVDELSE